MKETKEIENKKKTKKVMLALITIFTLVTVLVIVVTKIIEINKKTSINSNNYNEVSETCSESNNVNEINLNSAIDYKPIIYLYPEQESEVTVKLGNEENLTCTYPKYESEGWKALAKPTGDLVDLKTGRNLYSLYWEGINTKKYNGKLEEGFVVKGEDTIEFLEEKLEILGLSQTEAQEFIVYWLPQMGNNKYNYIRFQTKEEIEENMPLEIQPKPDTIIRVMMEWKALDEYVEVKEQKLETPQRKGFVAVEWGGTKIK